MWRMDLPSPCCLMMVSLMSVDSSFLGGIVLAVLLQMTVACGQQCLAVPAVPFHGHSVLIQFPLHHIQGRKRQQHAVTGDFCTGGGGLAAKPPGGEVWRGGPPPLHGRKNFKFRFKKATKSAHFSSLRRVSDDFCTALYVYETLRTKKTQLYKSGLANNYIAPFLMLSPVPRRTSPSASPCLPLFHYTDLAR